MDSKFILSICQCVIDELDKAAADFYYVSDAVVYNDYHDLRNNCPCNSGHTHYFAYVYCRKHEETFTMLLELQLDSVLINLELLVMIILIT